MLKSKKKTTPLERSAKRPASGILLATILIVCAACSAKNVPVHIEFAPVWTGNAIQCDSAELSLTDLRFYVSNVALIDSRGNEHSVSITPDERWQQRGVALIDLEDGSGTCSNGTADIRASLEGIVTRSDFVGVKFTIGVPFEMNHANPLLAQPPLDDAAMHWHWRSGYKFLRAGISRQADSFWIHLGSTGCEGTIHNISGCNSPNRVEVKFPEFSAESDLIAIELSELFQGVDLENGTRSDCSSSPAERACAMPFAALGLNFDGTSEPRPQRVFQVRH
jgi:uncharacterized repeat protein (TIGR04052 family)